MPAAAACCTGDTNGGRGYEDFDGKAAGEPVEIAPVSPSVPSTSPEPAKPQNPANSSSLMAALQNGSATLAIAPGASFTGGTVSNTGTVIANGTFSPGFCDGVVIQN